MAKVIPIGRDNFRDLRSGNNYYVDKTLMIKEFLDYDNVASLITRPRRFGKTLNMTMLREFFDINQDSSAIFEGLKIMETAYANQINSRPVIYLTLKNCSGASLGEMSMSLAKAIRNEYFKFETLFSNKIDAKNNDFIAFYDTYEMFRDIGRANEDNKSFNENERKVSLLKNSLVELIKAVSVFYDKKTLLLIDEYDQPLIKAQEMGYREKFSKDIYGPFLGSALKGNDYLDQALLTGIQRVAKESIFSEINNFVVYTVLNRQYANCFGLTTAETRELLAYYDLELNKDVTDTYDGYCFAGIDIYNPWSILNYAHNKTLQSYWINTSTNGLIRESIIHADARFHKNFKKLIANGSVATRLTMDASFIEIAKTETLWGLLVNAGYLTVTYVDYDLMRFTVRIPNNEIKREFELIVSDYTKLSSDTLQDMFLALIDGDMEEFLNIYRELVLDSTSFHDSRENAYHMLFLGMAMNLRDLYEIKSNIETGFGRCDIMMKSKDSSRPHIIIEFKQGTDVESLKYEALKQIHDKKYYAGLTGDVLCVGIAHDIKVCQLVSELVIC